MLPESLSVSLITILDSGDCIARLGRCCGRSMRLIPAYPHIRISYRICFENYNFTAGSPVSCDNYRRTATSSIDFGRKTSFPCSESARNGFPE